METQTQKILDHLKEGCSITPLEALNLFGCFRLSARIYDLREMGHTIHAERETVDGKTFARYTLLATAKTEKGTACQTH